MEEQGLKVMLEHAEEERMSVEVAEFRRNLKTWNRCIFGSSNAGISQSMEEFVQIRLYTFIIIIPRYYGVKIYFHF